VRRLRQLLRALWLRCPLCGRPWPRQGAVGLARQCPTCQVYLERHENDSFLGAYTLNLFGTLLVVVLVTMASVRWAETPAAARYGAGVLAIGVFALWFYPRSKLLWLAVDVQFRPPEEKDFDET
jgi:hypothetical protein